MRCKTSEFMVDRQAFLVYAVYKSKTSARVGQSLNRSSIGASYAGEDRGENLFQLYIRMLGNPNLQPISMKIKSFMRL